MTYKNATARDAHQVAFPCKALVRFADNPFRVMPLDLFGRPDLLRRPPLQIFEVSVKSRPD